MAYYYGEQIDKCDEPIPAFANEIISSHDQLNDLKRKLREYFKHGVRVSWLIYPEDKIVEVLTPFKNVKICTDDDVCSSSTAIDDYEITVNQLFSE